MSNKNIHVKAALFIGLLGFHTFSSCVSTREGLGVNINHRPFEQSLIPTSLGDIKRSYNSNPVRFFTCSALLTTGLFATIAGGLWGLGQIFEPSNAVGPIDMNPTSTPRPDISKITLPPNMDETTVKFITEVIATASAKYDDATDSPLSSTTTTQQPTTKTQNTVDLGANQLTPLSKAIEEGDESTVKSLTEQNGININNTGRPRTFTSPSINV